MPRPKPKSTIGDLMIFTIIGLFFTRLAFREELHAVVQLMFVLVFCALSCLKLRADKKAGRPLTKAFISLGISLAAIIALAYVITDTYLMEHGS